MFILFISKNILMALSGFGVLQGVCLGAVLYFNKRSDRSTNIFLSAYILCISLVMTEIILFDMLPIDVTFYNEPFTVLIGPFLYLYIRSFKEKITWRKALPHLYIFFPFFIITC